MDTYKDALANVVTMHGTSEKVKVLFLHSMEDAVAEEDMEMIYIKRQYQDVTISYMSK